MKRRFCDVGCLLYSKGKIITYVHICRFPSPSLALTSGGVRASYVFCLASVTSPKKVLEGLNEKNAHKALNKVLVHSKYSEKDSY